MKDNTLRRRCMYGGLALLISVLLFAVDRVTKYYVCLYLQPVGSVPIISGLLEFTYLENSGAAFGMFQNMGWLVSAVTIVVSICICAAMFLYKNHTFFSFSAFSLLVAGGLGNLIDRFRFGFVVDFIHVLFFDYIFNFADCCVTVGAVFLVIHVILISYREKRETDPKGSMDVHEDGSQ